MCGGMRAAGQLTAVLVVAEAQRGCVSQHARQLLADSLAGVGGAAGTPTTHNWCCLLLLLLLLQGDGRDLIIVDTSGRHKQEAALFEEMRQVRAGSGLFRGLGEQDCGVLSLYVLWADVRTHLP